MCQKFLNKLIIALLLFTLSIETSAHTGGTDSEGGHYNRSTGEYHYHHGFPAHQHEDGLCPYSSEKDETETSESNNRDISIVNKPESEHANKQQNKNKIKSKIENLLIIIIVFSHPFIIAGIASFLKNKRFKREQQRKWQEEHDKYFKLYAFKDPITLVDIPDDVFLRDNIPVTNDEGRYGAYTVYITRRGQRFHQDPFCVPYAKEKHLFEVYKTHTPCKKCVKKAFPRYKWYIEYRKIFDAKKKYNIP